MLTESTVQQVWQCGYALTSTRDVDEFLALGKLFGTPRVLGDGSFVKQLAPLPAPTATRDSMTARFGTSAFPYHTDGAFYRKPPRYVLLRCERETPPRRHTLVLDMEQVVPSEIRDDLRAGVWQIRSRRSFYCSLIEQFDQGVCMRWDPNIMTPAHRMAASATEALTGIIQRYSGMSIEWAEGRTAVIDNWRMLHARASRSSGMREDRVLQRIYVDM